MKKTELVNERRLLVGPDDEAIHRLASRAAHPPSLARQRRRRPARPILVRLLSPLGLLPRHPVAARGARLIARDDLVVSAVDIKPFEKHGIGLEHHSDLEFMALEEIRFFASISLAVPPADGMAYVYPLVPAFNVERGLPDDVVLELAHKHLELFTKEGRRDVVLPPVAGGPSYEWTRKGVNVERVAELVRDISLTDHLLMRGLGALLRANMAWEHREIAEAGQLLLYVALEASFQLILRVLRERGLQNPSRLDAGALIDEIEGFYPSNMRYFEEFYEGRIKTIHPSNRFGIFPVALLEADDFYFLRRGLIEVYHWLITKRWRP
jgi:hypothetical protein